MLPESVLYNRTMQLLLNRPIQHGLLSISQETGLPVGWLHSIINKPSIMPSVDRVEKLFKHLAPKEEVEQFEYNLANGLPLGITAPPMKAVRKAESKRRCDICKERSLTRRLIEDHCHKTGKVRGFICRGCNTGLGFFRDDPKRLRRAAKYLLKSRIQIDDSQ